MQTPSNVVPFRRLKPRRPDTKPKLPELPPFYKAVLAPASSVEWFTPPALVRALGGQSGFDVDPCTPEDPALLPMRTARRLIPPSEDGLTSLWPDWAFVWMNPPYGRAIDQWLHKLANHPAGGIALVPANMDARWMHDLVLGHSAVRAVLITRGRLKFVRPEGSAQAGATSGSVLVAYGDRAARHLKDAVEAGAVRGFHLPFARTSSSFDQGLAANDDAREEKAHG